MAAIGSVFHDAPPPASGPAVTLAQRQETAKHRRAWRVVGLTIAIALMNAYNRMAITFRTTPAAVAAGDGGNVTAR